MRIFLFVALMGVLIEPAFSQGAVPRYGETDKEKSQQEIQAEKDSERAYKKSLRNIPDKAPTDPWGTVRSNEAPKSPTDKPKGRTANSKAGSNPKTGAAN